MEFPRSTLIRRQLSKGFSPAFLSFQQFFSRLLFNEEWKLRARRQLICSDHKSLSYVVKAEEWTVPDWNINGARNGARFVRTTIFLLAELSPREERKQFQSISTSQVLVDNFTRSFSLLVENANVSIAWWEFVFAKSNVNAAGERIKSNFGIKMR